LNTEKIDETLYNTGPIIIIASTRSGSNLLKDVICKFPGCGTWNAENTNSIWKYGSALRLDDELKIEDVNKKVLNYIRGTFNKLSRKYGYKTIVDLSHGNSLRVPFVNEIFPQAKFVFIVRNGLDSVASGIIRSNKSVSLTFLFKKFKYVPLKNMAFIFIRYILIYIKKFIFKEKIVYNLPIFKGMLRMHKSNTKEQILATQWVKSYNMATNDLNNIHSERVYKLTYEDLVDDPKKQVRLLMEYLGYDLSNKSIEAQIGEICGNNMLGKETASDDMKNEKGFSTNSVGKWEQILNSEQVNSIMPIIEESMREIGYL
jgi:hypothetical protein